MNTRLVILALALCAAVFAGKDPKECEVCRKVLDQVVTRVNEAGKDVSNQDAVEKHLRKFCKETKNHKEGRFCYYVGASTDSATGLVREVTGPLSRFLPTDVTCQKLKKKDGQICDLQYDEPIDLSTIDLKNQRVKTLKKILSDHFNDECKGCLEKKDFIKRIEELRKTEL